MTNNLRNRLKIMLSLLPLLLMVTTAAVADSKPPNIVLIISDDQGYTDYGFMVHPAIETPHLDKLARESALFRRGYVPTALCRPSLMTLVTGLVSHQNKTTGNNPASTPNKAHAEKAGQDIRELSLIDVYPSLVDLAGFEIPDWLDGTSIKPQLAEPSSPRPAAISSYGEGNTSIRTQRWRHIRYEDGSEELYDHRVDPDEWTNLANKPEHEETKRSLAQMIPANQHPGLKVQDWFDKYQK
jgi:arylsulfatase A-like enzyme